MDKTKSTEIKDAATIVIVRKQSKKYKILMGQRGKHAIFMPNKFVFPGGAYDTNDSMVPFSKSLPNKQKILLSIECSLSHPESLAATVIRELWEETGLRLSSKGKFAAAPISWKAFFLDQQGPNLSSLNFFFRAVTPPGRSHRFDARFFFCDSSDIFENLDDFSEASGELIDLQWVEITQTKTLNLPIITTIVIKHLIGLIHANLTYDVVPFYSGGSTGLDKKFIKL